MVDLAIDPSSSVPPFEQLKSQIAAAVADGELAPGTRLPPVRRLAEDLSLAAGTVARAYRELELDGMLDGRGRQGTFVTATGSVADQAALAAARRYLTAIRELGLADDVALDWLQVALRRPPV